MYTTCTYDITMHNDVAMSLFYYDIALFKGNSLNGTY